jgi:hypothetical protein
MIDGYKLIIYIRLLYETTHVLPTSNYKYIYIFSICFIFLYLIISNHKHIPIYIIILQNYILFLIFDCYIIFYFNYKS